jgi:hypothetical protein
MLFFDGADGDGKPLGDLAVRQLLDLAEQKYNSAPFRKL